MTRGQRIALAAAAANLALILAFPPFDVYSIANLRVPVFGGFLPFTARDALHVVNTGFLALEVIVVLVNAGIAWLLLQPRAGPAGRRLGYQNALLVVVAVNLLLIMLFPPFESAYAITRAALPTFEGFFFVFLQQPHHVIVTALLYLEATLILVNGGLLWLLLREPSQPAVTARQAAELARQLREHPPG